MGWEVRKGKRYYYRKERRADGRVVSVYCGGGEREEAAEREDRARSEPEASSTTADFDELRRKKESDAPAGGVVLQEHLDELGRKKGDELAQVSGKKGNGARAAAPPFDPWRVWLESINDPEQMIRD